MKRVFIDTGAFFAHLIADDIENPRAHRALRDPLNLQLFESICEFGVYPQVEKESTARSNV